LVADTDAIHDSPQLLELQAAQQPPVTYSARLTGDDRRWQEVVVDREAREQHALDRDRIGSGNLHWRGHEPARDERPSVADHERELAELGELQHVVAKYALLLPCLELGLMEISGNGVEDPNAARDVELDLLGGPPGDPEVALPHGLLSARLQRGDGERAVGEQRQHGGQSQEQGEARSDSAHGGAFRPPIFCVFCAGVQLQSERTGSVPCTTRRWKSRLTARVRSVQTRKRAGGSASNTR
jgi:hypothetical protein